ncbi:hypothetical protein N7445_010705 [Penicillium cf. griseofulvum]|nr:hypothetical protein N7445_010705 [Penicillium cf. griseofulvum]
MPDDVLAFLPEPTQIGDMLISFLPFIVERKDAAEIEKWTAVQCLEGDSIIPMTFYHKSLRTITLIGDPDQIPPDGHLIV